MAQQVPLLQTCSLTIAPGAMAAIVGARGCGKTALAELLQRLYDVDAGTVLLDGHDVRSLDRCHI
jgi:ABC-type bacteriocin/lantibiotic exporter with double-glycine peptidase domain